MQTLDRVAGLVQIEGHGLRSLGALEGLVKLELVSSQIMQAKDLRYLSRLTHLRHLDTGTFEYITNDVLQVCIRQLNPFAMVKHDCQLSKCL